MSRTEHLVSDGAPCRTRHPKVPDPGPPTVRAAADTDEGGTEREDSKGGAKDRMR